MKNNEKEIVEVTVVVDFQYDFLKGVLGIPGAEKIAPKIQQRVNTSKVTIYTLDTHEKKVYQTSEEGTMFPLHCEYGTKGWNLFKIKPATKIEFPDCGFNYAANEDDENHKEYFFCKDKFDIFLGNSFFGPWLLNKFDPKTTIFKVCGVATEYCVKYMVEGLINLGYKVEILEDCIYAIDEKAGIETLNYFKEIQEIDEMVEKTNNITKGYEMTTEQEKINVFAEMVQKEYMMTKEERISLIDQMGDFAIDYAEKCGLNGFVLGISGGLDSAFAAYTIRRAIDRRNSNLKLIGLSIPISNTNTHMEQAAVVGKATCTTFMEYDAFNGAPFDDFMERLSITDKLVTDAGITIDENVKPVLGGNVKARMRMVIQYDIARKANAIVVGTENNEENYLKFFTKNGDESCDIIFMNKLFKGTEMWQLAEELGIPENIIYQAPSDGLGVTEQNTDEAQLGANYKVINAIYVCEEGIMKNKDILDFYEKYIKETAVCKKIVKRANDLMYKVNGPVEFDFKRR